MIKKKQLFILLILCMSYISLQGTNCCDRFFIEQHVALAICNNYDRGAEKKALYYKGVTKALNDYIALRIKRGELENKRFDIYMLDPILTCQHYSLTQSSKAYYIQTGRHLNLEELMCMVDEFTKPDFTAIDIGLWEYKDENSYNKQLKRLERIEETLLNKRLPKADTDTIRNKEYVTHHHNKLKIVYKDDKVRCFIHDKEIENKMKGLPWIIKDRYIFQEDGVFKVYQDSLLIKTFRYKEEYSEYMDACVFTKWVNFIENRYSEYSYSYDKNKFYHIRKENLRN